ncbi:hypothetical protein KAW65_00650 [candidate division WOR-3 bacterium]|nr:hypothetical protein [candidate division WOR-3 bacterium]
MEERILNYLAGKVMDDLRIGIEFSDELIQGLNKYPFIDYIRKQVTKEDIHIIKKMAQSEKLTTRRFGISLTRKLLRDREIQKNLFNMWKSMDEYEILRALMFQLLSLDDLPFEMHNEIYNFVRKNWTRWRIDAANWYGGKERIFSACLNRLKDPSQCPESKSWVYLCMATLSPEKDKVKELISRYLFSKESINAKVAADLVKELEDK